MACHLYKYLYINNLIFKNKKYSVYFRMHIVAKPIQLILSCPYIQWINLYFIQQPIKFNSYFPVSIFGASTALDSGDPFWRK